MEKDPSTITKEWKRRGHLQQYRKQKCHSTRKNTCQGINQAPFIYKSVTTGKIASVTEQYPPTYIC